MTVLQIDVETYSSIDLKKSGVHRYVEAPDFEILLFAFAFDDDPVTVIDLTDFEDLPKDVIQALQSDVIKTAWNAAFERTAIAKHIGIDCDPHWWRCSMAHAYTLGLPGTLEKASIALGLDEQKDSRGKSLIRYFSSPCKPTKVNGGRLRNHPHHDPEKWQQYIEYNQQDVVVEREVRRRLERFPVPEREWRIWALDQVINDRGVRIDSQLVSRAIECSVQYTEQLLQEAKELTGLENPNSLVQLKTWFASQGMQIESMNKDYMPDLLKAAPNESTKRMLKVRQEMGKTSVGKYNAMELSMCVDERVRGILQYCGASRTWRWAGRRVQMHNLPQNHLADLAEAREALKAGDYEWMELMYGRIPFVLSELIRTALLPAEGCRFIVSDFSAIEARVIAWLADEDWVLEVFKGHGKIYEATAARMFGIPFETIVKGHENYKYRPPGKVATLACGFGGGAPALASMDKKREIPAEEYPRLVRQWREANPNIRKLWYRAEEAAMEAVRTKSTVKLAHGVQYRYKSGVLFADLPSGHSLAYPSPAIKPDPKFDGKEGLTFKAPDKQGKMVTQRTWGGTLVENLVQAIARDCLAESLLRLDSENYVISLHVHDEVVLEVPIGTGSVEHVTEIMGRPIDWAPGLPLKAAGFECDFYQKKD
ncbi:DNA polymerase [Paenibacillus melissococcoides]|uniref:DNA-directed DNA polymerase n=1 Tax=Paenibacillus melissococcoides TaxID=2912268 RepID=A0ABM9GD82_9BACL|nr:MULTISPECIES: DNA polymerase [Paenibacillus]CAH8245115.1 DNA polymerase [Paenibacillus melissococcoides]CAH8249200.1 DNA polymerase [Paenibacillus melissococcoides]CAH8709949.1 DNA polymerase [Paenibacillus melissococcoides]CAH8710676.1 DNA polymerase [Paenibacillus melissococcoides]GIO81191.1 DNA polymerase [Paenibacillus dendritiformis]